MINRAVMKRKFESIFTRYNILSNEFKHLAERVFCKRKLIVISEKGISSIPVSSGLQGMLAVLVLLLLLWVSFSTGKYITYEGVLSQKNREIWNTNVTNEGLQSQMADLHQNLVDLNKYFENIKQLDQVAQNVSKSKEVAMATESNDVSGAIKNNDDIAGSIQNPNIRNVLSSIRGKVIARISSLENIIQMSGLNLHKVADNNVKLKNALLNSSHLHSKDIEDGEDNAHQGGPYNKVDENAAVSGQDKFESEINYLMQLEGVVNAMPISSPLKDYAVSSKFGRRVDPIRNTLAMHAGMDLAGEYKSKIYSSAPGKVEYAAMSGAYGLLVTISHGSGISTLYGHMDRILVREGETVKRGQLIGLQGSSGRSTGTHLHYEVRINNQPINPANFLEAGKYVF